MPKASRPKKQAVIVVHGMGEQRPMETLRSFVTAVWGTDAKGHIPEKPDEAQRTWIVPDRRTGILDLPRITTKPNDKGVRTDFFELYWADVFTGNTLQQLSAWLRGLLLRWPVQVPADVIWAWALLWALSVIAASAFLYVTLSGLLSGGPMQVFQNMKWTPGRTPATFHWLVSAALAVTLLLFMQGRLIKVLKDNAGAPFAALSRLCLFAVPAALFLGLVFLEPWGLLNKPKFWLLALAFFIAWFIKSIVVPYLGDVARYTQNAPWAIEARATIRARGLGLLRELHGLDADDELQAGAGEYQRIIVVGHSLGSVIAYDLLRYFWAEAGPVGKNKAAPQTMQALKNVDDYLKDCFDDPAAPGGTKPFVFSEYRALQSRAGEALCARHDGWKITDFVTLGCPLTHAEFLIANDNPQFKRMVRELILPASRPVLDETRHSFLYDPHYRANGGSAAGKRADHGSLFAATRWTNIYDPASRIFFGDFISGPLTENFREGLEDIPVNIRIWRKVLGWRMSRLFTHTQYWNAKACGELVPSGDAKTDPQPLDADRRDHILALKQALALGNPKPEQPKSRSAPAVAHPAPADRSRPESPPAGRTSPPS
jgi:hypothetical protein